MFLMTIDFDSIFQNKRKSNNSKIDLNYINYFKLDFEYTAFVRHDDQVNYQEVLEKIKLREVGWHPHFFINNSLIKDIDHLNDKISNAIEQIPEEFKCVRVGGCQGNKNTLEILKNKFDIDSTPMSKSKRKDKFGWYDWSFYESRVYLFDNFFQFPITTIYSKTNYDSKKKLRYLNPCYNHDFFKQIIEENFFYLLNLEYIMLVSHADEICTNYKDDLLLCGYDNFYKNLSYLNKKFNYEFITLRNYRNWWSDKQRDANRSK